MKKKVVLVCIISFILMASYALPRISAPIPHETNISCWVNGSSTREKVLIINGTLNCFSIIKSPYQCFQSFERSIQEVVWIKHRYCHVNEIVINSITIHCGCGTGIAPYYNLSEMVDLSLGEIYVPIPTVTPNNHPLEGGIFLTWKNLILGLIPFVILITCQAGCIIFCRRCYWCKTEPDPEPPEEREEIDILTGN